MSGSSNRPDSPADVPAKKEHRPSDRNRWHRLFHTSADPLFVLNHKRQIVFANAAWEQLTGVSVSQARGKTCKPAPKSDYDPLQALLQTLAPPTEICASEPVTIRRVPPTANRCSWDISFFPVQSDKGGTVLVCKIASLVRVQAADRAPLPNKLLSLRDRRGQWHRLDQIGDATPEGQRQSEQALLACRTLNPVYIGGEPGTGKQWLARTIHLHGLTRDRSFVSLDCRRLSAAILHNTLFGNRGVLTSPTVGSVYFKDPHRLSKELQAQISDWWRQSQSMPSEDHSQNADRPGLRLLAGGSVDLNSSSATNDLLEDFACLLSVLTIELQPLRQRNVAFANLTQRLLKRAAVSSGQEITDLSPECWDCLRAFHWPGNLTELYRVLQQACLRSKQSIIQLQDIPLYLREPCEQPKPSLPLDEIMEQVERRLLQLAMERTKQNKTKAAEHLSIWRARLIRRLKDLGLSESEE